MVPLVRALWRAGSKAEALPLEEGLVLIDGVLDGLALRPRDRALLGFVARLTLRPRGMDRAGLQGLLAAGFTERQAHDAVHVVACFSYMNRLADGLGVAVTVTRETWARELFGEAAWQAHLRWAEDGR